MNPYEQYDLKKFIESIPHEEIEEKTRQERRKNKRIYKKFLSDFYLGKCFICGEILDTFTEGKPCFHWFTYPNGIKKKHFKDYLDTPLGFFQLNSYFRWLANTETPILNISDLKDETSHTS